MRWIPIRNVDQGGQRLIRLPCPAIDMIRLAIASPNEKRVSRLLRRNPALLLHALDLYRQEFERPPASAHDLVHWYVANAAESLLACDWNGGSRACDALPRLKKTGAFFDDFLAAESNRKLRLSLGRFLSRFTELKPQDAKSLTSVLVGKRIRADQFRCKGIRSRKTLTRVVSSWRRPIPRDVDVNRLLSSVSKGNMKLAKFESELRNQKLAAMKQLAYGASHEINNPLANIATRAQTLLAGESEPEKRHKLTVIYEQAMRAHEMISDMMLFAHPPAILRKRISLRLLMFKIISELGPLLESSPATTLEVKIGAGVDQACLDSTQIAVLIKNLIQNSIEAIRSSKQSSGCIEVRIDRTLDDEIQFSVWDNGIGVSDKIVEHLFDPFFSGREAGRGLGFGLSKVWTIAQLHGGGVGFDRNLKTGTRFFVHIPVHTTDVTSDRLPELSFGKKRQIREEEAA